MLSPIQERICSIDKIIATIIIPLFFWIPAATTQALEYRLGGEIYNRFYMDDHFWDGEDLQFARSERYNVLTAAPSLSLTVGKFLSGYLQADVEWFHFFDPGPEDALEPELTGAYVTLSTAGVAASIGKMPLQFGKGLITASDEPAVSLHLEDAHHRYLTITGAQVMDTSPMAAVTLGYRPGFLERIECFGVFFQDEDNGFADMLNQSIWVDDLRSEGHLYWLGVGLDLFIGDLYASGVAMLEKGDLDLSNALRTVPVSVSGYLVDVSLDYNINDRISVGAFCFLASGDANLREKELSNLTLNTFLSPLPFNPRGAIFFDPEFSDLDLDQEDMLWPGGVTISGAVVPGVRLSLQVLEPLSLDWMLATYYPEQKPADDRDWYGWETDVLLTYRWSDSKKVFLEADLFRHGNYFRQAGGGSPEAASRIMAGFHLIF